MVIEVVYEGIVCSTADATRRTDGARCCGYNKRVPHTIQVSTCLIPSCIEIQTIGISLRLVEAYELCQSRFDQLSVATIVSYENLDGSPRSKRLKRQSQKALDAARPEYMLLGIARSTGLGARNRTVSLLLNR